MCAHLYIIISLSTPVNPMQSLCSVTGSNLWSSCNNIDIHLGLFVILSCSSLIVPFQLLQLNQLLFCSAPSCNDLHGCGSFMTVGLGTSCVPDKVCSLSLHLESALWIYPMESHPWGYVFIHGCPCWTKRVKLYTLNNWPVNYGYSICIHKLTDQSSERINQLQSLFDL